MHSFDTQCIETDAVPMHRYKPYVLRVKMQQWFSGQLTSLHNHAAPSVPVVYRCHRTLTPDTHTKIIEYHHTYFLKLAPLPMEYSMSNAFIPVRWLGLWALWNTKASPIGFRFLKQRAKNQALIVANAPVCHVYQNSHSTLMQWMGICSILKDL